MSACGQTTAGSELQQNKLLDCVHVELYILIVVYLCVNSVTSMSFLPMVILGDAILNTVPMKKVKIVLSGHSDLVIQSLTVPRNTICQSVLQAYPHILLDLKLV